jgi:hypothetical protein
MSSGLLEVLCNEDKGRAARFSFFSHAHNQLAAAAPVSFHAKARYISLQTHGRWLCKNRPREVYQVTVPSDFAPA